MEQKNTPVQDIGLLDVSELKFYRNAKGFLALKKGETEYKRVKLTRAVPMTDPDSYVAVSDMEDREIGILKSLFELSGEQRALLAAELDSSYYCPVIGQIFSIKEKMGYFYFDVELKDTKKLFAVKDISRNIKQLDDGGVIISDVDGNRFVIKDLTAVEKKSLRKLEPYLY